MSRVRKFITIIITILISDISIQNLVSKAKFLLLFFLSSRYFY